MGAIVFHVPTPGLSRHKPPTSGFVQWPSEYILIDRIKPSDISGWHGVLDIRFKKRNFNQERLFVRLSYQDHGWATAQSPIRWQQL